MVADSSEANGVPTNASGLEPLPITIRWEESSISEKSHAVRLADELPTLEVGSVEDALNLHTERTEGTLHRVLYASV